MVECHEERLGGVKLTPQMNEWGDPVYGWGEDELSLGHEKFELLWVIWVKLSSGQLDMQVRVGGRDPAGDRGSGVQRMGGN